MLHLKKKEKKAVEIIMIIQTSQSYSVLLKLVETVTNECSFSTKIN